MRFKSPFSNTTFDSLKAGDFFFHPLAGGHSPAIKVVRADGEDAVIDLNLEQQRGEPRLPTLMDADAFEGQTVIAVETAFIRPKLGVSNLVNGAGGAGSIGNGALVLTPAGNFLRVKGPRLATLVFDVDSGKQGTSPDSAKCLWADEWQIVIEEDDKDLVLFERKLST
jgi:hypothetical protein